LDDISGDLRQLQRTLLDDDEAVRAWTHDRSVFIGKLALLVELHRLDSNNTPPAEDTEYLSPTGPEEGSGLQLLEDSEDDTAGYKKLFGRTPKTSEGFYAHLATIRRSENRLDEYKSEVKKLQKRKFPGDINSDDEVWDPLFDTDLSIRSRILKQSAKPNRADPHDPASAGKLLRRDPSVKPASKFTTNTSTGKKAKKANDKAMRTVASKSPKKSKIKPSRKLRPVVEIPPRSLADSEQTREDGNPREGRDPSAAADSRENVDVDEDDSRDVFDDI
jgi:hypothetical protein